MTINALIKRCCEISLDRLFQVSPLSVYNLERVIRGSAAISVAAPLGGRVELHPISFAEYSRFLRLLSKEPETIRWIDGFGPDAVLLDIGANVGVYSIYTLLRHAQARVISLEPEPMNFSRLVDNLQRTDPLRAVAYPFAVSANTALGQLAQNRPGEYGTSFNQLGGTNTFKVGCFVCSVDDLIDNFGIPVPTHIKIDVDGIEVDIVKGMSRTLRRPEVASVLVESQSAEMTSQLVRLFAEASFVQSHASIEQSGNQIFVKRAVRG